MNQKPFIPSWPGVFLFDIRFSAVLRKSMCISVLGPSSNTSSSLVILFIHSAFLLCFLVAILSSKIVRFLWHPVVGMFSGHSLTPSQLLIEFSFVVFESPVLSVLFLPFVDISLIFLLSPALSGLFPQVVLLFFLAFPVPFFFSLISVPLFFLILAWFCSFFLFAFAVFSFSEIGISFSFDCFC